jgi:hypothetical protein
VNPRGAVQKVAGSSLVRLTSSRPAHQNKRADNRKKEGIVRDIVLQCGDVSMSQGYPKTLKNGLLAYTS